MARILSTAALVAALTAGSASAGITPLISTAAPHNSAAIKFSSTGSAIAWVGAAVGALAAFHVANCFLNGKSPLNTRCGS